jgi:hypothetical protein
MIVCLVVVVAIAGVFFARDLAAGNQIPFGASGNSTASFSAGDNVTTSRLATTSDPALSSNATISSSNSSDNSIPATTSLIQTMTSTLTITLTSHSSSATSSSETTSGSSTSSVIISTMHTSATSLSISSSTRKSTTKDHRTSHTTAPNNTILATNVTQARNLLAPPSNPLTAIGLAQLSVALPGITLLVFFTLAFMAMIPKVSPLTISPKLGRCFSVRRIFPEKNSKH